MKINYLRNIKNNDKMKNELINYIRLYWKDESANEIIKNINNLFVLYFLPNEIINLKDKIDKERYTYLIQNNLGTIGGYILYMDNNPKSIKLIKFCDTTICKMNILIKIIEKYHQRYKKIKYILPNFPIKTARYYWFKYLQMIYSINTENELNDFLKTNKLEYLNYCFIKEVYREENNKIINESNTNNYSSTI